MNVLSATAPVLTIWLKEEVRRREERRGEERRGEERREEKSIIGSHSSSCLYGAQHFIFAYCCSLFNVHCQSIVLMSGMSLSLG